MTQKSLPFSQDSLLRSHVFVFRLRGSRSFAGMRSEGPRAPPAARGAAPGWGAGPSPRVPLGGEGCSATAAPSASFPRRQKERRLNPCSWVLSLTLATSIQAVQKVPGSARLGQRSRDLVVSQRLFPEPLVGFHTW